MSYMSEVVTHGAATAPLNIYGNDARQDILSTVPQYEAEAKEAGYSFGRTTAYVYTTAIPGTVPLQLFYNEARKDNFTAAHPQAHRDAYGAGYRYIRTVGYVYPATNPAPGSVPLKTMWSAARTDNALVGDNTTETDLKNGGFQQIRVDSYGLPSASALSHGAPAAPDFGASGVTTPLSVYSCDPKQDIMTATGEMDAEVKAASYQFGRTTAHVYTQPIPGTIPLQLYHHEGRKDHFTCAHPDAHRDALANGYRSIRTIGYVYSVNNHPHGAIPLKTLWSAARTEHAAVADNATETDLKNAGFVQVRIDSFVLPSASPLGAPPSAVDYGAVALPLNVMSNDGKQDITTVTGGTEAEKEAKANGYSFGRTTAYCYSVPVPGTVPLHVFYSDARKDSYTCAHPQAHLDCQANGYRFVRTIGYVYPTPHAGAIPLNTVWSAARTEHAAIADPATATDLRNAGFVHVREDCYVLPNASLLTPSYTSGAYHSHSYLG